MSKPDGRPLGSFRAPQLMLPLLLSCGLLACGGEPPPEEVGDVATALNVGWGNCPAFNDYEVCLCEAENLLGFCQIYGANPFSGQTGFYPNPQAFAPLRNDTMSSVALGGFTVFRPRPEAGFTQTGFFSLLNPPSTPAARPTSGTTETPT